MRPHFLLPLVLLAACGGSPDPSSGGSSSSVDQQSVPRASPPGHPVVLASGLVQPWGIALDTTSVYFTDDGAQTVGSVPKAGGSVSVLASGLEAPRSVAVDADHVYVGELFTLEAMARTGGARTVLAKDLAGGVTSVAVDGTHAYYTQQQNAADRITGGVGSVPLAGGATSTLGTASSDVFALTISGGYVYWTSSGGITGSAADGAVYKTPVGGGPTVTLAEHQPLTSALLVDGDDVFFAGFDVPATVSRVSVDGGPVTVVATATVLATSLAVDSQYLYWTDQAEGTINRVARAGGRPFVLVDQQDAPRGLAIDADNLYWTNAGASVEDGNPGNEGSVMKLVKGSLPSSQPE